jgi:2-keto-4-pentenoate hydratase/2-oxohepta-3-ene-1,7-dioic acid hydratase in catechol pathway
MRLASFRVADRQRFGLSVDGTRLHDLTARVPGQDGHAARTLQELIEAGPAALAEASRLHAAVAADAAVLPSWHIEDVVFDAPVMRPSKICCLALNNSANVDRIMSGPKHPAAFLKAANSLAGHRARIEIRRRYGRVHPEPELAVVIGRVAKDVPVAAAYDHVFGYTVHNDVTSPTMRAEDTFHYRAIHAKKGTEREIEYVDTWVSYPARYKGCDTFSCMGPWLVTRDEVPDPHALAVECRQDGELVTADNTANLFHKVPEVVSFLSGYMTLFPGDILSMGTALKASANGSGVVVQNVNLARSGTTVTVSIEKLGTLENTSHLVD